MAGKGMEYELYFALERLEYIEGKCPACKAHLSEKRHRSECWLNYLLVKFRNKKADQSSVISKVV